MSTPLHSWVCAACGRRVPLRVAVCHCGATRQDGRPAAAAAGPPHGPSPAAQGAVGLWRSLPLDVLALLAAAVLSVAVGLGWLLYAPPRPAPLPAVLGYVDVPPPTPSPSAVRQPPFRMPWWK